jgi:hypothetical protein
MGVTLRFAPQMNNGMDINNILNNPIVNTESKTLNNHHSFMMKPIKSNLSR